MGALGRDLRSAFRQLVKNPGFTVIAVLILGLGIGLNSAVFSLVNALLLRPLPVRAPGELAAVFSSAPGDFLASSPLAAADYLDLAERSRSFSATAAYLYSPFVLERGGESRLVLGVRATPGLFSTLGVRPALGRLFAAEERRSGAGDGEAAVDAADGGEVVLSDLAWRRHFGADPHVVGTVLRLNGESRRVIGVTPPEFFGLTRGVAPEAWIPLSLRDPQGDRSAGRELRSLWVVGRLAPGVPLGRARADLRGLAESLAREFPATHRDLSFIAVPANRVRILPGVDARLGGASAVVLGVVALVLLIAGTNVANLLLARALARRREIAVRRALGAGTAAVVRQLMTESLILALCGALLGIALAAGSNAALAALRLPLPIDFALGLVLDHRVVLFTLLAALLTAVTFGLAPALSAARGRLYDLLREGSTSTPSRGQRRLAGLLVVGQLALSLVLLVDAGLAVRSLRNANRVDPGFDPEGVVLASFAPHLQGYSRTETESFFRRLLERVRALPGVESAALASHLPLSVEIRFDRAAPEETPLPEERWAGVDSARVGPDYFATMRIPVLRGRPFRDDDRPGGPRVAVLNQALARTLWPRGDALGRRLRIGGEPETYEVVGLVRDGKYRTLGETPRPFLYRDLEQDRWRQAARSGEIGTGTETLIARTRLPAPAALAALRRAIHATDERIAVARLQTMRSSLGVVLFLPRLAAILFALFGLLGLVIAGLGIYGLMAYTVGRRTRELAVRAALGASRRDLQSLVLRQGLALAAAGIAAGLALAATTTRALRSLLYGIDPLDAPTFLIVPALLALVALAATVIPARRAARLDPLAALRSE